jgi:hypothetical protein
MLKKSLLTGAMIALGAAGLILPGQAWAQASPWCQGQASVDASGQVVVSNFTPPGPGEASTGRGWMGADPTLTPTGPGPGGIADTCEVLSMGGHLVVLNGGSTTDPRDGQNAQHESTGHGPAGQR